MPTNKVWLCHQSTIIHENRFKVLLIALLVLSTFLRLVGTPLGGTAQIQKDFPDVLRALLATMNIDPNSRQDDGEIQPIKFIVSAAAPGPDLRILHGLPSFYAALGYSPEEMPLQFSSLLSYSNSNMAIEAIERCIRCGEPLQAFINLTHKDRRTMSCYVSIESAQESEDLTSLVKNSEGTTSIKYSVVAVHSISVVGLPYRGALTSAPTY